MSTVHVLHLMTTSSDCLSNSSTACQNLTKHIDPVQEALWLQNQSILTRCSHYANSPENLDTAVPISSDWFQRVRSRRGVSAVFGSVHERYSRSTSPRTHLPDDHHGARNQSSLIKFLIEYEPSGSYYMKRDERVRQHPLIAKPRAAGTLPRETCASSYACRRTGRVPVLRSSRSRSCVPAARQNRVWRVTHAT
jgi:hypothetical protein